LIKANSTLRRLTVVVVGVINGVVNRGPCLFSDGCLIDGGSFSGNQFQLRFRGRGGHGEFVNEIDLLSRSVLGGLV
jgi:hypothetical protein